MKIQDYFNYDPVTGIFTRKIARKGGGPAGQVVGNRDKTGYVYIMHEGKNRLLHRLAFLFMTGSIPEMVDHINGIKYDNRWVNLRPSNVMHNAKNQKMSTKNTSGQVGVTWHTQYQQWQATISHDGKRIYLGRFIEFDEAVRVRKQAEVDYQYSLRHGMKE